MVKFITNRTFIGVFFSVLVTVFSVAVFTYATTIGSNVSVTGTLSATGATTLSAALTANGNVTLGDAITDTVTINGVIQGFVSNASSTVSGRLNVDTSVGVASSTPSQELGIIGSALFQETSGTTTIGIISTGSGVGSCIQLRNTDGSMFRIYAGATTTMHNALVVEAGSCL